MHGHSQLEQRRVLVVEDDWFIASYVTEALEQAGAAIIGPVASASDALERLEQEPPPHAATLNVRLLDGDSLPVAQRLAEMDVPFLFLSAQAAATLPPDMAARPRLEKPFAAWQVIEAVGGMLDR
ncbi:response regulator [Sphingomonas lenta]|uniref:Response regulator n=1 Tax=Sphingomonas lenta TaxID=1141887 RepID=A0A2A2SF82_9SPHN|nr:response regulator [Sphingomonas lenta]PAX07865.1 response regulator [Sphingomonas lenta]